LGRSKPRKAALRGSPRPAPNFRAYAVDPYGFLFTAADLSLGLAALVLTGPTWG
jgi:hypothetical protein